MSERVDIGRQLRTAREKLELELEDVRHRQRIPVPVLKALEESDYSVFSSPAYARSYLKQYSEFVKVDATDWLDSFDVSGTLANLDAYDYLKVNPANQPTGSRTGREKKKKISSEAASAGAMVPVFITLITAVFLGAGYWGYNRFDNYQAEREATAATRDDGAAEILPGGPAETPPQVEPTPGIPEELPPPEPFPILIDHPQPISRAVLVDDEPE